MSDVRGHLVLVAMHATGVKYRATYRRRPYGSGAQRSPAPSGTDRPGPIGPGGQAAVRRPGPGFMQARARGMRRGADWGL